MEIGQELGEDSLERGFVVPQPRDPPGSGAWTPCGQKPPACNRGGRRDGAETLLSSGDTVQPGWIPDSLLQSGS